MPPDIPPTTQAERPLHILIVHQSFASLAEAGGTRHHELARYLAERGHRVTIITSAYSYLTGEGRAHRRIEREKDGERITILRVAAYNPPARPQFFQRVWSFISFMQASFFTGLSVRSVDLIWGTSPPIFQGVTAWLLARLKRVPFLFEIRDLWPAFAIQVGVLKQPFLIWASQKLERLLYRHADRVMVNSPGFIQHVKERGARQVELFPNGADPGMFQPDSSGENFRRLHHLGESFTVFYAGAHGLSNDLGVVLDAARLLLDAPEIQIVLLGDGKEKPVLMATAARECLTNITFLQPIAKNEMAEALAAADACLAILKPIPLYATTYPNKVFDYMAAGRPVILAIDGVVRQVVESSHAGVFVPPGDPVALAKAIRAMAELPDRGRSMGQAGRRKIVGEFSRADLARRLGRMLEEMGWEHG
jgi:glycosyltransferase involved in cell wall biosynthesis